VAFDPQGGVLSELTDEQDPEAWVAQLASPSPYAVLQAIRALGDTDESDALEAILGDEARSPIVRARAALALGRQRASEQLLPHVRAGHDRVRRSVVGALGKGTDGKALPVLEARLRSDKNPDVRAAALSSITQLSEPRGLSLARRLLADRHRKVIEEAVDVLGDHGSANDVSSLITPKLRRRVRNDGYRAAARILGRADEGPARDRAVSLLTRQLVAALDDVDLRSRQTAVHLLESVGDKSAVPHLEALRRAETVGHIADGARDAAMEIRSRSDEDAMEPGDENKTQVRLEEMEKRLDELESEVEAWRDKH
jgi:HEAT repeat protein